MGDGSACREGWRPRPDELPVAIEMKTGTVSNTSKADVMGNIVRYGRPSQIGQIRVPTNRLNELTSSNRRITTDEHSSALLKRPSPSTGPGKRPDTLGRL